MRFSKPLVAVTWLDAEGETSGDYTEEEARVAHKPPQYISIGLLVIDDPTGITIFGEVGDDGRFRNRVFIPRGMISEVVQLLPAQPARRARQQKVVAELPQTPPH